MGHGDGSGRATEHRSAHNANRVPRDRCMPVLSLKLPEQSNDGLQKVRRTLIRGWRPLAFLLITLISFVIGLHFKALSDPGQEGKQFANLVPPWFHFSVSDRRISADISAYIQCQANINATETNPCTLASPRAYVFFSLKFKMPRSLPLSQASILMTSSVRPLSTIGGGPFSNSRGLYEREIPLAELLAAESDGFNAAIFSISDVLHGARGSFFGKLPTIDSTEYGTQLGGHATTFWPASNFSVTEDLVDVAQVLGTQQLVYVTPPGTFDGEDYIWNASNVQLGPVFKSTDPDASAAQSDNAFFSGIFLGIAGGAAIALLGELPGEIPLPNWLAHRKRTHK